MKKLVLSVLLLPACSWSSFDELSDETWVDSAGPAEGIEPNDLVAVASPGMPQGNAVFVVLGRATDSVGGYSYDADGARTAIGVDIRGGATQFGPLAPAVVMAGDPYSNVVGVAAVTGAANDGDTKVVHFEADNVATIVSMNDFNDPTELSPLDGPIQATGMAYARTDDDGAAAATTDVVLARANQLAIVQDYAADAHTLVGCLPDTGGNVVVQTVGAGQFDAADPDDEIVLVTNDMVGTAPQIVILDGSTVVAAWLANGQALAGCFDGVTRLPVASFPGPAGDPAFGGDIVVADFDGDGLTDVAITSPADNGVTAYLNDGTLADGLTGIAVDATLDASLFGASIAAGDLDGDGDDDLVIGAPQSNVEGASNAGAAYVYSWDGAGFVRELTVHDAQPEAEQRIGQAVAIVPWAAGQSNVLVVSGDQEIFTYFRTLLYPDVRQ